MKHPRPVSEFHPAVLSRVAQNPSHFDWFREAAIGERAVWVAVITQAVIDARSTSNKSDALKAKAEALAWFGTPDFDDVCIAADLDPTITLEKITRALLTNAQWRLPAGEGWRTKQRRQLEQMETVGNA